MSIEPLQALGHGENAKQAITSAIRQAANQTGIDFDLMLGVAKRESSLRADAEAATSSAAGLFQFLDQTWLEAVKKHGDELGLSDYARDIQRTDKGFTVADPARRDEILDLRFKPAVAAKVAGKTLGAAKERLSAALGREASGSEVYMAHFLGERGAARMLNAGDQALAASVDPRAAQANQPLFYEGSRALSVAEFRDKIALHIGAEPGAKLAERPSVRIPMAPPAARTEGPVGPIPTRRAAEPVVVSEGPRSEPRTSSLAKAALSPQLYAAIVEMQSNFILGGKK